MRPALVRIAVAALAVPALTLLGASTAQADAPPSPSPSPHSHSTGGLHDEDGWRDLKDARTDSAHTDDHTGHDDAPETERPRAAVLTVFGTVNAGVLVSAAVVRRRSRARDARAHGGTDEKGTTR
ncbi:hypothetical protein [Streptomyces sp. NPDC057877]|uniref:hypothetical protein n=1 Tax=Streptomyces sp. NPDC057877 TaxID=3346269 RepID=UPI0036C9719F